MAHTPAPHSGKHLNWRAFFAPFSIIATVLYVVFFALELIHYYSEPHETKPPTFIAAMQNNVSRQIAEIRQVDAFQLAGSFTSDLYDYDCTWYLHCESTEPPPLDISEYLRTHPLNAPITFPQQTTSASVPPRPTRLVIPVGPLPVPTFHTLFGTPHALGTAASSIAAAGRWAVLMFISCSVIYAIVLILLFRSSENRGFFYFWMIMAAPFGIPAVVTCFQFIATLVFHGIHWALGLLVVVCGWASALSLIVAVPHIVKAPHEVLEAAENMREL